MFHSVLFEVLALLLLISFAFFFVEGSASTMTGLAIGLSLIAMAWNYIFNMGFDKIFGTDRINRSISNRLLHGLTFELGMLILTLPLIMWALNLSFLTALLMDIGFIVFFLIYAIAFNWVYDKTANWIKLQTNSTVKSHFKKV
ncbi:PACE efflux transporter [Pseudoalteromonas sp. '520P1 No. 423']|uniref:PACE efflux transporter n=1 Tax=unclassified Pseudoalteromonas TaxID=194690 RepID=UPI0035297423